MGMCSLYYNCQYFRHFLQYSIFVNDELHYFPCLPDINSVK